MPLEQADSFKYISWSPPFPQTFPPSAKKARQLIGLVHRKLSISFGTECSLKCIKCLYTSTLSMLLKSGIPIYPKNVKLTKLTQCPYPCMRSEVYTWNFVLLSQSSWFLLFSKRIFLYPNMCFTSVVYQAFTQTARTHYTSFKFHAVHLLTSWTQRITVMLDLVVPLICMAAVV